MESWDALYPFTSAEINLFSRLHQKVTKFPAPSNLKTRETIEDSNFCRSNPIKFVDNETKKLTDLETELSRLESELLKIQTILRDLDLLIEAHKQLSLAIEEPKDEIVDSVDTDDTKDAKTAESPYNSTNNTDVDSTQLNFELSEIQSEIKRIESLNSAIRLISTCSIPSVASSPPFVSSLSLLISTDPVKYAPLINRAGVLMRKCWDNALVAMERVLERDLVSLEDYLDDPVYKELRDRVLKPLLNPFTLNTTTAKYEYVDIMEHFIASYTQLRINSVTFILDHRLNNQFVDSKDHDQILHLIERTRLLMVVESRELTNIFGKFSSESSKKAQLNKILETVGNLLYQRIDPLCSSLSPFQRAKISGFIHPLMKSILINAKSDPFGFFLKLLSERHFPEIENYNFKQINEAKAKETQDKETEDKKLMNTVNTSTQSQAFDV